MAYEKHTWETGETITAEKLNNLEDGVQEAASGDSRFMIINITATQISSGGEWTASADVTYNDIKTAYDNNKIIIANIVEQSYGAPSDYYTRYQALVDTSYINYFGFMYMSVNSYNIERHSASVSSNNEWTYSIYYHAFSND